VLKIGQIMLMNFMKIIITNFTSLLYILLVCLSQGCTKPGWIAQESGTENRLLGVWFSDENTGTVVGDRGTILRTTDGGDTWTSQTSGTGEFLWGVRFADSMNGWVVGEGSTILHTTDGGATWIKQPKEAPDFLESVFCLNSDTAWAAGFCTILHTTNGGATWTIQRIGITTDIWDVFFTDADTGTAVGGWCLSCAPKPYYGGYILRTTDGGINWNIQRYDTTVIGFYGVFFTDTDTGFVVGAGGTILHTTNGGVSWTQQISGTTKDLKDVFFANADTGTIVGRIVPGGLGGIILRTTNDGKTWIKQKIPTRNALYKVCFTEANTGTAVGYNGTILHTTTGGEPLRFHFFSKISDHTSGNNKTIIYGERSKHLF